jgi:hypothetical protein
MLNTGRLVSSRMSPSFFNTQRMVLQYVTKAYFR